MASLFGSSSLSPRGGARSNENLHGSSSATSPRSNSPSRIITESAEDSPTGGFWRRLKKKVSEPFIVTSKRVGSPSPSRDNSLEVAAQRMREAQDEENMKTRVKDIIRRDLLFYPTFRNALQGNTDRTARSLQYAELYDRYKDLYAPLLYEDPDDSDWSMDDREDSMFLEGYDPKRAASLFSRQTVSPEVAEADIAWAKAGIEDKEIADELSKMQKKLRDRNEIYVLLTAAKRQVLGAGLKTVRWDQKSGRELADLFGSEDRAREIQQMEGAQKDRILSSVKAQIKELGRYQEEIAHHYAFCQEILKRASDALQIDNLIIKLKSVALEHRDEWTTEIGRELAKRREALEIEQEEEREKERLREEEMQRESISPRDNHPELDGEEAMQTKQEESLLYEISSKAREAQAEPPQSPPPTPSIHPKALTKLLSLEAGGSLHLPKMMAINFASDDQGSTSRPSLQQDEGGDEVEFSSRNQKFVSVRKKDRKPSLNEMFIIGKRETIQTTEMPEKDERADSSAPALKDDSATEIDSAKKVENAEIKASEEVGKQSNEDFIILFKYDGKAYRCNEKEKNILERQVKILDPSTFRMLLDDFQLDVFAVLDETGPGISPADSTANETRESDNEEEIGCEEDEQIDDEEASIEDLERKPSPEGRSKNRRRRRRRRANKNKNAEGQALAIPEAPASTTIATPDLKQPSQGVELGGRVWTKSPVSPFSPSKRAHRVAEKNNTMRDTMRQRMQRAYEEELNKQGEGNKLNWKRERKQGGSHGNTTRKGDL